ncbi:MAG: DUF2889 domain-containing protein [Carboxydocellales bacterium]
MALFNRVKSCSVEDINDGLYEAKGTFIDTLHEVNLTIQVKKDNLEIVKAKADLVRTPQKYCTEAQDRDRYLVGLKIGPGLGKAIEDAVGKEQGCVHLADLTLDLAKAVIVANNKVVELSLNKEEIVDKYIGLFSGTCCHWTTMGKKKAETARNS